MPAKPITLGPLHFAKRGDAASYLKTMLSRYEVGDRVNASDEEVLLAAIARHPRASEKIGCGVASFSVRSADYGSKCFWINRPDGTTEDFSYASCLRN